MRASEPAPILSVGELLWDLLPSGPRLGGTTTNFAILAARLGNPVTLVSRVGNDDFGLRAAQELDAVAAFPGPGNGKLDLGAMQLSTKLPTGTVGVRLDEDGRPQYTIHGPVAWDEIGLDVEALQRTDDAAAICFGTLAQREARSRATIRALVEHAEKKCVRVCDMNLRMPFCDAETLRWCLARAAVLKISDEELPMVAAMLEWPFVPTPAEDELTDWAAEQARTVLAHAPMCKMVAITLGAAGSLLANRRRVHRSAAMPVRVADTVGAGDAFTAGMVHAYLRGARLETIGLVSNLCGSYVASQAGATPALPEELLERIARLLEGAEDNAEALA